MNDKKQLVYIASKVNSMEGEVSKLIKELNSRGYEIGYDWTKNPISKPFRDNTKQASAAAEDMAKAVMNCDVLILLTADNGLGMYIETGGALVAGIISSFITDRPQKRIFVVGPEEERERSIFYFHKSVRRFATVEELLGEL